MKTWITFHQYFIMRMYFTINFQTPQVRGRGSPWGAQQAGEFCPPHPGPGPFPQALWFLLLLKTGRRWASSSNSSAKVRTAELGESRILDQEEQEEQGVTRGPLLANFGPDFPGGCWAAPYQAPTALTAVHVVLNANEVTKTTSQYYVPIFVSAKRQVFNPFFKTSANAVT